MSLKDELQKGIESATSGFKSEQITGKAGGVIKSVFIPIKTQRDGGELRVYLEVSGEAVDSPEEFSAVLDWIEQRFDLAVWRKSGGQSGFKSGWKRRY